MQFKFNVPLIDEEGNPVIIDGKEKQLSDILREGLRNEVSAEKNVTYFGWCIELAQTGTIDLDSAGIETFKKWIQETVEIPITTTQTKKSSKFSALVEYRILEIIKNK